MDAGKSKEEAMQMCKLSEVETKKEEVIEVKKEESAIVVEENAELKIAQSKIEALEKEIHALKNHAVLKSGVVEGPVVNTEKSMEPTLQNIMKLKYGGQ
jgi:hypothetical protein